MFEQDNLRLLVTGSSGQVGGELLHSLESLGTIISPSRAEMDLGDLSSVRNFIRSSRPNWIINAGAYTAVDKAESERELAYLINAEAPGAIGAEAANLGASVIHFSTDYVFSGLGTVPYVESDPTGPLGIYGASKLAGEQALLASGADVVILRTSWVYGATGKNFLRTILKLAREREELRIVNDQHGAPTWSRDLARLTAHIIARPEEDVRQDAGVYHAAGSGDTTWAGFAEELIAQAQLAEPGTRFAVITGIPTSEYPTPAARPLNSRLNCGKLEASFLWRMMDWKESCRQVLAELRSGDERST